MSLTRFSFLVNARFFLFASCLALLPQAARAQSAPLSASLPAAPLDIDGAIARGQAQLNAGDIRAVATLEGAARASLLLLADVGGQAILTAPPEKVPTYGPIGEAAKRAASAHLYWGYACDRFARRDAAVMALARATRFAGPARMGTNTLARDAQLRLSSVLREGLPLDAPDDTLDTLAAVTYAKQWTPRRTRFELPDVANVGAVPSAREFLITSGKLLPPSLASGADPTAGYTRVPPVYKNVPRTKLPQSLLLDKTIIGYERALSGPNKGLWHQVARIYYASPYNTRDHRDDRPRAEAVCEQFLKLHALWKSSGVDNLYASDRVTTLWLSEVSSQWPDDADDPIAQQNLGVRMPGPNTPLVPGGRLRPTEIETSPFTRVWMQTSDDPADPIDNPPPGDVLLFKLSQPRTEAEWLREISHEYGHAVLPPFGGFVPPNEPFGNGLMGETLGVLWAASSANTFAPTTPLPTNAVQRASLPSTSASFSPELSRHVARQALPALQFWNARGPGSALRRDGSDNGLRYLQGLNVYLERVYGARALGTMLRPLMDRALAPPAPAPSLLTAFVPPDAAPVADDSVQAPMMPDLRAENLINSARLRDPFEKGKGSLPIWLPGALQVVPANGMTRTLSVADLLNRAPLRLKLEDRATGWLMVPANARALRIEFNIVAHPNAVPNRGTASGGAPPLFVEDWKWKTSWSVEPLKPGAVGPGVAANQSAISLDVRGRSGWQRFAFSALARDADVEIRLAQFER